MVLVCFDCNALSRLVLHSMDMNGVVWYYIVSYCLVVYCLGLSCNVLDGLQCMVTHCVVLCCIAMHYLVLCCIVQYV